MHTTAQTLFDRIESMPIYDTHEHLPLRPSLRIRPADVLTEYLSHYFDKDLISAGMPKSILEQALDTTVNIETRFAALEPWWDLCRFTGYGQSLDESVRGLYNEKRIDRTTIGRINEQFQKNLDDPGYFRTVLKDRCHICKSINDGFAHMKGTGWSDDELFAQVLRLDGYLDQWHWVFPVLESYGEDMHTLDGYLAAVKADLLASPSYGYRGYKLGVAYSRPLRFGKVSKADAQIAYTDMIKRMEKDPYAGTPILLQDYILHFCLSVLQEMGAFVQIHTGFQEGNGNIVSNSDPMLLTDLFLEYPALRFDLFHIGYPYVQTCGVLGKLFPNVTIDFAWVNIISPLAAENALAEYLDVVPRNKIMAFGGDYLFVDGIYGHQCMARRMVARALARKVDAGIMDLEAAEHTAKMLLHDNVLDKLLIK